MIDLDKLRELVGRSTGTPSEDRAEARYELFNLAPTLAADLLAMSEENAQLKREVDAAEKRADDQYFRAAGLQEKLGEIEQIAITRHTYSTNDDLAHMLNRAMLSIANIARGP